jgi:transcriptional regulator with XRE-family HTH domain
VSKVRFADWLRRVVEAKGWRQRDLADAAGVSQQTASRWLLAQTVPNVTHAQALALALGVTTDEVLQRLGGMHVPRLPRERTRDLELAELRARVERLEAQVAGTQSRSGDGDSNLRRGALRRECPPA